MDTRLVKRTRIKGEILKSTIALIALKIYIVVAVFTIDEERLIQSNKGVFAPQQKRRLTKGEKMPPYSVETAPAVPFAVHISCVFISCSSLAKLSQTSALFLHSCSPNSLSAAVFALRISRSAI